MVGRCLLGSRLGRGKRGCIHGAPIIAAGADATLPPRKCVTAGTQR
ncbi:hypothetical protein ACS15_3200 [Ralstonia insidiosa]|uniref:Uncharacterized protein n=1 Tax=Ralstonia insidiosa TaxID=190721 RepID=A0AAC9BHJ2_9RALS|nr:hypothetical protein ACS15_3200 [Ralstonia insidiosa]